MASYKIQIKAYKAHNFLLKIELILVKVTKKIIFV